MLKIVPEVDDIPSLSTLERTVINNFKNYFATTLKKYNVTLYVHPDTINADISMVLDNHIDYHKDVFHQLWLVNVVDSNQHKDYAKEICDKAKLICKFKNQLLWNRAFDFVEYPKEITANYRMACHFQHLTLKQRFGINTLVIADHQKLSNQVKQSRKTDSNGFAQYQKIERIKDLNPQKKNNYFKLAHAIWVNEMSPDNELFEKVMAPRSNALTALTGGEYDIAKYFIGFNLTNENIAVHTKKLLQNPQLATLINDPIKRKVAVRGLAKTGKTTLLVMRALHAANRGETITITSYTYANLARIRLMLQKLSESTGALRLQGISLQTVSKIIYNNSLKTDALYIDNAEDITKTELKQLLTSNNFKDIFVAYNPYQQVLFNKDNRANTTDNQISQMKDKDWPLNEEWIKKQFYLVSADQMVNNCAPAIKMVYHDFLNDYTDNVSVTTTISQQQPAVYIRDDVSVGSPILTNDELQIIKGAIDKQFVATNKNNNNQFTTKESQGIAIVCPQFSFLVQISMFLDQEEHDKKQGRSFLTYKEIINQSKDANLKFAANDKKDFKDLINLLTNHRTDEGSLNNSEIDNIEYVRQLINNLKNNYSHKAEIDLHRFLPAMMNRLILSTLETFKGLQAEKLVAIIPADTNFKLGNYTTILSSAKQDLIIINRNKQFHKFIENERDKRSYSHNTHHHILIF